MKVKWNIDIGCENNIPDFDCELLDCEVDDLAFELSRGLSGAELILEVKSLIEDDFKTRVGYCIKNYDEILEKIQKRLDVIDEEK